MAELRYGKYVSWDGYHYFSIEKKTFFGWKQQKVWILSWLGTHSEKFENNQREQMMESVECLIKAGHTVI